MDEKTKNLIAVLKELKSELEERESENRNKADKNNGNDYYEGYYEGIADGYAEAAYLLGKKVSEWAEECMRQMQI